MNEAQARDLLLVRAIESEDHDALLLTREDRQYATRTALASAPIGGEPALREMAAFLGARARLVLDRLEPRYPNLGRVGTLSQWPGWLSWGAPLAAFAIGVLSHEIDGNRLNILAFPLLGMLAWNAFVYGWILLGGLFARLFRRRKERPHPLRLVLPRRRRRAARAAVLGHDLLSGRSAARSLA